MNLKTEKYLCGVLLGVLFLGACSSATDMAKAEPKAAPQAGPGQFVVALSPSGIERMGQMQFGKGMFGIPSFKPPESEKLLKGEMSVLSEKVTFYLPAKGPYSVESSKEDSFENTSTAISVDANNDQELVSSERWFSSSPVRMGDQMFTVKEIDPGGTWIWLSRADVPLSGLVVGKPCPDFKFKTMDGKPVSLRDYKGKALLLDVWSYT